LDYRGIGRNREESWKSIKKSKVTHLDGQMSSQNLIWEPSPKPRDTRYPKVTWPSSVKGGIGSFEAPKIRERER